MMRNKYHWFNKYTGEVATTFGLIKTMLWTIKHRDVYHNLDMFKYAFSWQYSIHAY